MFVTFRSLIAGYQLLIRLSCVDAVVIKGTQIYDSGKGAFVDLGILDVLQIFGRAGAFCLEFIDCKDL